MILRHEEKSYLNRFRLLRWVEAEFLMSVRFLHLDIHEDETQLTDKDMGVLITMEDRVFAIGSNFGGRLGMPTSLSRADHIREIPLLSNLRIKGISIGENLVLGWTTYGRLFAWGSGVDPENANHPRFILPHHNILKAAAGIKCSALTADGTVFLWTEIEHPVLWDFSVRNSVQDYTDMCGRICALTRRGQIYMWKYNEQNPVPILLSKDRFANILGSKNHFVATKFNGKTFTLGNDGSNIMMERLRQINGFPTNGMQLLCGSHAPICLGIIGSDVYWSKLEHRTWPIQLRIYEGYASIIELMGKLDIGSSYTIEFN